MSVQDWGKIKREQPQPGQQAQDTPYMKALKESLSNYVTDPVEQKRLFDLLDKKAGAKDFFIESQGMRRSFAEVVADNSNNTARKPRGISQFSLHDDPGICAGVEKQS